MTHRCSMLRAYEPLFQSVLCVCGLFSARLPVIDLRGTYVVTGFILGNRPHLVLRTESDAFQKIAQAFFEFFLRLLLVDLAQVVLDDPFGNGVDGGFMTAARTFLLSKPLARQLFFRVNLRDGDFSFATVLAHQVPFDFSPLKQAAPFLFLFVLAVGLANLSGDNKGILDTLVTPTRIA